MYICTLCHYELTCTKNSVGADYGHGHVYAGDLFKCPSCGFELLATNHTANYDPDLNQQDAYITMKGGHTTPCTSPTSTSQHTENSK